MLPLLQPQDPIMEQRFSDAGASERLGRVWWLNGKISTCQCRRHEFNPWSRKIPTYHGASKPKLHNYWAHALEPMYPNYWSLCTQEPGSKTKAHALQQSSPHSPHLEKAHGQQWRLSTNTNNILKIKTLEPSLTLLSSCFPQPYNQQHLYMTFHLCFAFPRPRFSLSFSLSCSRMLQESPNCSHCPSE